MLLKIVDFLIDSLSKGLRKRPKERGKAPLLSFLFSFFSFKWFFAEPAPQESPRPRRWIWHLAFCESGAGESQPIFCRVRRCSAGRSDGDF